MDDEFMIEKEEQPQFLVDILLENLSHTGEERIETELSQHFDLYIGDLDIDDQPLFSLRFILDDEGDVIREYVGPDWSLDELLEFYDDVNYDADSYNDPSLSLDMTWSDISDETKSIILEQLLEWKKKTYEFEDSEYIGQARIQSTELTQNEF